jgi:hypothetical protein
MGKRTWRHGFPPLLYPTHSVALLVGVTKERIVKVSALGQRVGENFPEPSENAYANPYNNEMALGLTNQGNMCRFGVFWNVAADGERGQWLGEKMSCYRAPAANGHVMKLGQRWQSGMSLISQQTMPASRCDGGRGGRSAFLCAEFIDALVIEPRAGVSVRIAGG